MEEAAAGPLSRSPFSLARAGAPVRPYAEHQPHRIVGLMSGTSADAIDAVLVEIAGSGRQIRWRLLQHTQHPLPEAVREAVLAVSNGRPLADLPEPMSPAALVTLLDLRLADCFATATLDCIHEAGLAAADVDAIASHGQTVCHLPDAIPFAGGVARGTLQLGRGPAIAVQTGIPVVSDFRTADMALGGQGAPLAPYADWVLFAQALEHRAVQNLGGIGNVTLLPGEDPLGIIAFDTGPANMLADAAVRRFTAGRQRYDEDGTIACRGRVDIGMLQTAMEHPYLERTPPKSTGHEDFGEAELDRLLKVAKKHALSEPDIIATLTALGPECAVGAYRRFLPRFPDQVILGGGGSRNPVVVEHFRRLCGADRVHTHEDFGISAQAKEGLAFAIMAHETLLGRPSNIPSATGASRPAILGSVSLP